MSPIQAVALIVIAVLGTVVVLTREPLRQALMAGFFGISLAALFFSFQAPDVALSQIVVGAVALPGMIVLALFKIHEREAPEEKDE